MTKAQKFDKTQYFWCQNTRYKTQIKHPGTQEEKAILDQVKPASSQLHYTPLVTLLSSRCLLLLLQLQQTQLMALRRRRRMYYNSSLAFGGLLFMWNSAR